jgi:hypothetical protein
MSGTSVCVTCQRFCVTGRQTPGQQAACLAAKDAINKRANAPLVLYVVLDVVQALSGLVWWGV